MKAIKITTADGKSITAGHEDAIWITIEYSVYPKENKSRYNVYAVVLQANRETFKHEWTPIEQSSPVVKLETIETETIDSPLSTHQWPIEVNEGKGSLFKRLLYAFSIIFGNTQVRIDEKVGLICSFCGKGQSEVEKIIAGPAVYICDECVELCNEIISEERKKWIYNNRVVRMRKGPRTSHPKR
jgi:hypothetical protein